MEYENITFTNNGAVSLETTKNNIVDFFMKFSRTISDKDMENYLSLCWKESPEKTVAIIFNGRDRNNGKKEKNISNRAMIWLKNNKPETYKNNIMTYIDKYGCWKDVMYINFNADMDRYNMFELKLIANKLMEDKELLLKGENVSLCAKWAPSEKDKYDRRKHSATRIAKILFPEEQKYLMQRYRTEYLTPLREKINIVEKKMCNNEWTDIDYEHVPGVAIKRLKNAFMKHDSEGYNKYLSDVRNGVKSIKVTGILPHELVNYYLELSKNVSEREWYNDCNGCTCDCPCNCEKEDKEELEEIKYEINETVELQWKTMVENIKKDGVLNEILPIVDVSGSMFSASNGSVPAQVAIALGLLISECSTGIFKNKVITFSDTPDFHYIEGETLFDRINNITKMNAGTSTNFEATSDLIIDFAKKYGLTQENMPKKLICLTDMQFNSSIGAYDEEAGEAGEDYEAGEYCEAGEDYEAGEVKKPDDKLITLHKTIIEKYKKNNYIAPKFIYWDLSGDNRNNNTFPVSASEEGTAIISGFSEQLLKIFMKYDEFTPEIIINELLQPYINTIVIDEEEFNSNKECYYPIVFNKKGLN
jgi:hypothetical protein